MQESRRRAFFRTSCRGLACDGPRFGALSSRACARGISWLVVAPRREVQLLALAHPWHAVLAQVMNLMGLIRNGFSIRIERSQLSGRLASSAPSSSRHTHATHCIHAFAQGLHVRLHQLVAFLRVGRRPKTLQLLLHSFDSCLHLGHSFIHVCAYRPPRGHRPFRSRHDWRRLSAGGHF